MNGLEQAPTQRRRGKWRFFWFTLWLTLMFWAAGDSRWQYSKEQRNDIRRHSKEQRNNIRRYNSKVQSKMAQMEAFIVQLGYDPNGVDDE